MNIIISHVYSADNKGDAALLGVLIDELKSKFKKTKLHILTMDKVSKNYKFDGVPTRPSFMFYTRQHSGNKLIWLLYGIYMACYTIFWTLIYRFLKLKLPINQNWYNLIMLYEKADLIVPVGGGYLRTKQSIGSLYDFTLLLHPIIISKILGKPTVLYTQSVGPIFRPIEKRMLSFAIKHCVEIAIIREDKSLTLLHDIGVTNCIRAVDAGFLLKSDKSLKSIKVDLPSEKRVIGVTARKWLNDEQQGAYEQAMAETLDYLIQQQNAYIVLIPQVTSEFHGDDDRLVSKSIFSKMNEKRQTLVLTENYSYKEIKTIYDRLDFLLGTRFHSVIFSLTSYVPALAIEYEHKTSGIMHDLKLDEWVVKMEDVNTQVLKSKMVNLIKAKASYKAQLKAALPAYEERAHDAINIVEQAYTASLKDGS